MSLSSNKIVEAKIGDTFTLGHYKFALLGLETVPGPNFSARVATIEVLHNGVPLAMMKPSRKTFPLQQQTTSDVAIETNFLRDVYTVLGEERDGAAVLRLHVNPLAPWIWLGALVMASGGALSLADRRLRVGAPSRAPKAAVAA
jgi:cytochrome c-type biogenesis protein CcmF